MTVADQIKTLDRKIMQNESQYGLDIKAAKISALSSHKLDKYEYSTGKDLDLKPSTVEQARFKYSTLGKIFNNGLKVEDKETLSLILSKKEVTDFVQKSFKSGSKGVNWGN